MYYIYTLIHPDNGNVFYVGMTTSPKRRMISHVYEPQKSLSRFINRMRKYGREPIMEVIREFHDKKLCEIEEVRMIRQFSKEYTLLNELDLYPEEDRVYRYCRRKRRCGKHGCPYCEKIEYDMTYRRRRDIINNSFAIVISADSWDRARKYMQRHDFDGYGRIPYDGNLLILTTKKIEKKYGQEIDVSEIDWENVVFNRWNTIGKRSFTGVYSL